MSLTPPADVWFGPGGVRGVFAAGVAFGIQESIENRSIDANALRLYGSSVGCLTAAYLATGNTRCGLDIFREDAKSIVVPNKLPYLIAGSAVNRLGRSIGCRSAVVPVPDVLKVDKVVAAMLRRTPNIVAQLRRAETPVFAEYVDRRSGAFCHVDLRTIDNPLHFIRAALNLAPLTSTPDRDLLDSNIKGYGFTQLLGRNDERRIVVVLNHFPARSLRSLIRNRLWAIMSADAKIAKLYAGRNTNCGEAVKAAARHQCVLLVGPPSANASKTIEQHYDDGRTCARKIIAFLSSAVSDTRVGEF